VLVMHYSLTVAACMHVLQALTMVLVCMSCRPLMALSSGALETCPRALGTGEPYPTGRPARIFYMLEAVGSQETIGHEVAAPKPSQ
jgi:hypothetical protein